MKDANPYDRKYSAKEFYWGKKPSATCDKAMEFLKPSPEFRPSLLDLGSGEGRNAIYFAKHGFAVTGLDLSVPGLEKTKAYAEEAGLHVETIQANIVNYRLDRTDDVVFSTGALHYLPAKIRDRRFQNYKNHTSPGGLNVMSVFVSKPFIARAPDADKNAHRYKSGELLSYYWDWEILYSVEEIFDCMSSGIPHRHAMNRVIGRKPRE